MLIVSPPKVAVVSDICEQPKILEYSALRVSLLAWFLYEKRDKGSVVVLASF